MRSRPLPFSAAAGRARSPVRSPGAEPACRRNAAPGPGLGAGGGGGSAGAVPNGCDPGRATRGLFENSTVGVGGLGSPAAVRRDRYTWQPGSPAARPPRPHKDGGQRPDRERRLLTVSRGPEPQAFYNLEPKELKEARKYHAPLVTALPTLPPVQEKAYKGFRVLDLRVPVKIQRGGR
ncbi:hypothetical protein VULLAG_LOCUS3697 [Vulpes lagopus]